MKRSITILLALMVALAVPMVGAQEQDGDDGDGPADESTWGRCVAYDASEPGNDASNGTVYSTPAFQNLSESRCDNATAPYDGTPAEGYAPEDPGSGEPDHPDQGDNPGDDGSGDNPDQGDNPGDDRRP